MATFADLAPAIERIDIRGTTWELRGLPFKRCVELISQFPAILDAFEGSADLGKLLAQVPKAGATLVAASLGRMGDGELVASFDDNLVVGEQVELVAAVLRASLPKGNRPFVDLLEMFGVHLQGSETLPRQTSSASLNGTGSRIAM